MRRFVGSLLVGLGGLLLVLAVGLPLYVAPMVTKLPYDMQICPAADKEQPAGCLKPSIAEATGATFLDRTALEIKTGTLRSTTEVVPQAKLTADWQKMGQSSRLDDNAVIWDVYGTAKWVEGNNAVISAYSTELALDRVTGAAIAWDGQWLDESGSTVVPRGNVSYEGQIYKFPFGTEQVEYKIYDRDLRKALPAQFVEVTDVDGVEAYLFRQTIDRQEPANVTPATVDALRKVLTPTATTAKIVYSNIREVWVDPVTGAFLNVREQQTKLLVPADGTDGEKILLKADFKYTSQTMANSVATVKTNQSRLKLVNLYGPIGLGVVGLVFLIVGFLLARGGGRPKREPGAWDAALPEPRHRLRGGAADTQMLDPVPGNSP